MLSEIWIGSDNREPAEQCVRKLHSNLVSPYPVGILRMSKIVRAACAAKGTGPANAILLPGVNRRRPFLSTFEALLNVPALRKPAIRGRAKVSEGT